jgi:transcriptional regulator with XRE-family HTH domain
LQNCKSHDSLPGRKLSDSLRQALKESKFTPAEISRATGLTEALLSRFLNERNDPNLKKADVLAEFLGLELRPVGKTKRK